MAIDILLTLKMLITTAADDVFIIFIFVFSEKTRLDISCEWSAKQTVHMKFHLVFSATRLVCNNFA